MHTATICVGQSFGNSWLGRARCEKEICLQKVLEQKEKSFYDLLIIVESIHLLID
jgi:hypothetical protein